MGILADVVLIVIIGLATFIGYKKGLVKMILKLISLIVAIVLALMLYKPVSNFVINKTQIDEGIENSIIEKITPEGLTKEDKVTTNSGIPNKIVDTANNSIENIAETLTIKIIEVTVLLILFILIRIILLIVTLVADLISKLPLIKQFNKAGGAVCGFVKGILIVYTLVGILLLINPLVSGEISTVIDSSIITKVIYNNNILLSIIL